MTYDYDLFVIGAGSAGLAAAKGAAAYGARVAIAEQNSLGGTCVNRGCIPKKLMVYASGFSSLFQDAVGYGWSKVQSQFNWQQFMAAKDKEIQHLNQSYLQQLQSAGVKLLRGQASFLDAHTLEVVGTQITAEKILIAVGGKPIQPNIPGIEHTITSREIFHLPQQPQRVAIIGGGYIGVEFAYILHGLGSQVTLMDTGESILAGFDSDICMAIQASMAKQEIRFLGNTTAEKIEQVPEGLCLTLSGDHPDSLIVDTVLCAIGRTPNVSELGLEKVGVEVNEKGAIAVDQHSRTTQANIFAVGDCTNRLNLTPVAKAEGHAFADTEFGGKPQTVNYDLVPSAVFSQPPAATVGLSEAQAREKLGDAVCCYHQTFQPLFHRLTQEDEQNLVKLVVDSHSDRILGIHIVGEHAAEIMQGMAIALNMGATKKDFNTTIGIHPSTAEELISL
jgi:glutathione reductase (NADPH)